MNTKRKLSWKQKLHFGSKRQRAAAKAKLSGHRKRTLANRGGLRHVKKQSRKAGHSTSVHPSLLKDAKYKYKRRKSIERYNARKERLGNVGEILTVSIPEAFSGNPGKLKGKIKSMARKSRKRVLAGKRVARTRARRRVSKVSNFGVQHSQRTRRNPSVVRTRTVYRTRSRNPRKRRMHRRNPGGFRLGRVGQIGGILAGAAVTGLVTKMLPASLTNGFVGYITTAITALVQGKIVGKVTKNRNLGSSFTTGGFVLLGLRVIGDMFPSLGAYIPFSLRGGMGIIANTQGFAVPLVNQPGSMGSYITPGFVRQAFPVAATGMAGVSMASGGSLMSARRTGRAN